MISRVVIPPRTACRPRLHWPISREECDPLPNNISTRNTPSNISTLQDCDATPLERLQDEHHTSRRARVVPVVDRSNSSFYIIAFAAVEVFLPLSVLGLHVNLI